MKKLPISQFSDDPIGIAVIVDGVLTDADANPTVDIIRLSDATTVVNDAVSTKDGTGLYSYKVSPASVTSIKGEYRADWTYTLSGQTREYETEFEVVEEMFHWDSLIATERQLVENVYLRLGDLFDSKEGGPYLQNLPQSTFGYETIARLMITEALPYINLAKPPAFIPGFQVGKGATKPFPEGWYGLLEQATFWAVLKHLSRSYIEQPDPQGITTGRLSRSSYRTEWATEAATEKIQLDLMLGQLKRSFRFSTHRALLVAGGMFPSNFLNPARPRWPYVPAMVLN